MSPYLPPEIEHIIFNYAAIGLERNACVSLLLVARRVYCWIRPILYRVLIITPRDADKPIENYRFPGTLSTLEDVGSFAHHVLFDMHMMMPGADTASLIIAAAKYIPNIRGITIWYSYYEASRIIESMNDNNLQPTWLTMRLDYLDRSHLRSNVFKSVTHLDVLNRPGSTTDSSMETWRYLAELPVLSHLRLSDAINPPRSTVLSCMLDPAGQFHLDVLVYAPETEYVENEGIKLQYEQIDDHRLVLVKDYGGAMATKDWELGTEARFDLWVFCERVSEARRRNFFSEKLRTQKWVPRCLIWEAELNDAGKKWWSTLDWN